MFKKSALAVVVAASMIPAAAMADTTVYGQAHLFFLNNSNIDEAPKATPNTEVEAWEMTSEASRLGVKGSAELEGNLEVIYKLEYEVDPTGEAGGIQKSRNQYVGLKGGFGQVVFGRHDTPMKKAQGKVDQFSDYAYSDMKYTIAGENRLNNLVYFKSPTIADTLNIHVSFAPGENNNVDGTASTKTNGEEETGIADQTSLAVTYKTDSLFLSLANDSDVGKETKLLKEVGSTGALKNLTRLSTQYKADTFGAGFLYATGKDQAKTMDYNAYLLSGYFKASDNIKLKAQISNGTVEPKAASSKDVTTDMVTLGADYTLGKKTTAAAYFTTQKAENENSATKFERDIFGLGLIHKF